MSTNVSSVGDDGASSQNLSNTAEETQTKKRRLTSKVWEVFDRIVSEDKKFTAICKYCKTKFSADSSCGTSHLIYHMNRCASYKKTLKPVPEVSQMLLSIREKNKEGEVKLENFKFDQDSSRYSLARMIILHEYPFSIVNHVGFRKYSRNLNPSFKMVSRNTIKKECMRIYNCEKEKLYTTLEGISSRLSLTTDMWTSVQNKGYLCLTAHFIDDSWKLRKLIINFTCVPCPHTGVAIYEKIYEKLLTWNVDSKLMCIVLDNCSTNDVVARELIKKLNERSRLVLNGVFFHMRCAAHILNLVVQDGIQEIGYVVENVRECVKYLKNSTARKERFDEVVAQVRGTQKQLVLDVPIRWNSTYFMLSTALELKDAFIRMGDQDKSFPYLLTSEDWQNVSVICSCLQVFHDVTLVFSYSKEPAAHLLFVKMNSLKYFFPKLYGDAAKLHTLEVKSLLEELHKEYYEKYKSMSYGSQGGGTSTYEGSDLGSTNDECEMEDYNKFILNVTCSQLKSDLETYLDEECLPVSLHSSTNILEWWNHNKYKYPIMSLIARDILAIPVSTVASEAAFSNGGRVLDQYRSSLASRTVEAIVCAQDWFRCNMEESTEEDDLATLYSKLCLENEEQGPSSSGVSETFESFPE
ncbi:hypothetical protein H6P81_003148 [Aristolochia fimbriata]|uniref:BED-type domain-containing protein n=1 Tax=Aristolochia fimbriata TaxID=158543 RepID=A0AAV7FBR9_ARIFI|nr:hypothetical protein H6P81_003148 [Aristolochia fimbriata]